MSSRLRFLFLLGHVTRRSNDVHVALSIVSIAIVHCSRRFYTVNSLLIYWRVFILILFFCTVRFKRKLGRSPFHIALLSFTLQHCPFITAILYVLSSKRFVILFISLINETLCYIKSYLFHRHFSFVSLLHLIIFLFIIVISKVALPVSKNVV